MIIMSSNSFTKPQQVLRSLDDSTSSANLLPYFRARDDPFFGGLLLKGHTHTTSTTPTSNSIEFETGVAAAGGNNNNNNLVSYLPDVAESSSAEHMKELNQQDIIENSFMDLSLEVAQGSHVSNIGAFESDQQQNSSPKTNSDTTLFDREVPKTHVHNDFIILDSISCDPPNHVETRGVFEVHEEINETSENPDVPITQKSYGINKKREKLSSIALPLCAASYHDGYTIQLEVTEYCESTNRLNAYLRATRDNVNAGVPGRFLHAVLGPNTSDAATIACTIMYAFYLNETRKVNEYCTVPIMNMKRADLSSHPELKWLLASCHIDCSSLVFIDEIDLSYYDLFGNLKLVLLNCNQSPYKPEELKEAVIEIFNCEKGEAIYPWVENVKIREARGFLSLLGCSCCTLIAEKFALNSPEMLVGQAFSRLLLAGILLDTANLSKPHCSTKDKYISSLLLHGAGRYGCNGLYHLLKHKMKDVSVVPDKFRKDFKKWKGNSRESSLGSVQIGMSSIGVSIAQLLAHKEASIEEIKRFLRLEKLQLLVIVSGYYDAQKNFKRELLVVAETAGIVRNFLSSNVSQMPYKTLDLPGLRDEMAAVEVHKNITSRAFIERLIEDFCGI